MGTKSNGVLRRKLGQYEKAEVISNAYYCFNVVGVYFLENGPEKDVLREALDKLQQRHPLLRMKISKNGNDYFFDSQDVPEIPLNVITRKQQNDWEAVTESNLNESLDTDTGPLLSCTYIYDPAQTPSELIITCHHVIVDAVSMLTIFHDTLSFCTGKEENATAKGITELPLLPPEEKFFPPAYKGLSARLHIGRFMMRQMGDEISFRKGQRGKRQAPLHSSGQGRILPLKIDSNLTERIIHASHKKSITLNSLLTAAMLKAVAKLVYKEEEIPLRYFAFANLRPYLKPPVKDVILGTYHAVVRYTITVSNQEDIWDLAFRISEQIRKGFHRGDKFIATLLIPVMMKMVTRLRSMRMGTVAMSFLGKIDIPRSYETIKILGARGYISNFPLGPEYSAAIRIFNKEFWWDILYMDSDMDHAEATRIAQEIQTILTEATKE